MVPVAEGPTGTLAVGRFGWKDQASSLLTFAGDAYVNEMGVTARGWRAVYGSCSGATLRLVSFRQTPGAHRAARGGPPGSQGIAWIGCASELPARPRPRAM